MIARDDNMKGIVVCPQPEAAEIGIQILEDGGNAFDAALAVAFVQMIVDPFMCGVGGMAAAHVWSPDLGTHKIIDGSLCAGSLVRPDMWVNDFRGRSPFSGSSIFKDYRSEIGYSSICVPGAVAAFDVIHRTFCTRPITELLQPAIRIASEGYRATPYIRDYLLWPPFPETPDGRTRLKASEPCSRLYLHPDGSVFDEGELIKNQDYSDTLELLAKKGLEDFYRGELAQIIAEDLERNGSWISREDLEKYQAQIQVTLFTRYRECDVYSSLPPTGGPLLLEALNILRDIGLSQVRHNEPDHLNLLASTLSLVFQRRSDCLGDPGGNSPVSKKAAHYHTGFGSEHTTQLVVVDHDKNIASITHSLGWASGVITPGLGFIYNNGMNLFNPVPGEPQSIAPGKIRPSSLMPTIVFQEGEPKLALGALGGNAILSACVQVLSNILDFGFSAVEAVLAPRIHAEGSIIWCESRIRSDHCTMLKTKGHTVERQLRGYVPWFGQVQIAHIIPDGGIQGGSDPRGGGGAAMYASSKEIIN